MTPLPRPYATVIAALALLAAVCAPSAADAAPSAFLSSLEKIAAEVTEGFRAKRPGRTGESLVVFTYGCNERLEKQRVGVAVAEMLTIRFVRQNVFNVMERSALRAILEEQKLATSGAVDAASAAKIGKLAGAKYMLLGSVERFGGRYHVNTRLVEVETGTLLGASIEEVEASVFETEASPYLVLVPEAQAIGLYISAGLWPYFATGRNTTVSGSYGAVSYSTTYAIEPGAATATPASLCLGARYFPVSWLMGDIAFWPFLVGATYPMALTGTQTAAWSYTRGYARFYGFAIPLSLSYVRKLSPSVRVQAGAGGCVFGGNLSATYLWADYRSGSDFAEVIFWRPYLAGREFQQYHISALRPMLRGGIEWRPQQRFAIAAVADLFPVPLRETYVSNVEVVHGNAIVDSRVEKVLELTIPPVALEISVSVYF